MTGVQRAQTGHRCTQERVSDPWLPGVCILINSMHVLLCSFVSEHDFHSIIYHDKSFPYPVAVNNVANWFIFQMCTKQLYENTKYKKGFFHLCDFY